MLFEIAFALIAGGSLLAGCSLLPDITHQPQVHNPFPQLYRIAVLPFYNQSSDPYVNGIQVAEAYYQELQQVPGFEVLPVGTVVRFLEATRYEPRDGSDFQKLAREMGVDAVVVGSITDFTAYYPPRMGLAVHWYAANPSFHPIPVGYGLPWGTCEEEHIPSALVREAEFELAREQLATQTPDMPAGIDAGDRLIDENPDGSNESTSDPSGEDTGETQRTALSRKMAKSGDTKGLDPKGRKAPPRNVLRASHEEPAAGEPSSETLPTPDRPTSKFKRGGELQRGTNEVPSDLPSDLPSDWPDPRGFVPRPPSPERPAPIPQSKAVMTHTRLYDGANSDITEALANYVYYRDDARFGGWQAYLQRSEDFIRFCCYMHISEMLTARGGADETRVVWRWPIGRYER